MKRTYLAKRNGLLSLTDVSWGVFAIVFTVFVLLVRLLAPNFFWYIATPIFRTADTLALESHTFFSGFRNTATLALQDEKLTNENAALATENQTLVQKVADIGALAPTSGIIAGVVARPPESPYDTLVLAAGSASGVTLGMEAFGDGGVPLGVVSSLQTDFSRVTLFSAPRVSTLGWVGNASLPLTLEGAGGGAINATASRSAAIAIGDTVFVPGPGALPIGKVVRIDSDPAASSVLLRIQSTLNLFSVTWVTLRDTGATLLTP